MVGISDSIKTFGMKNLVSIIFNSRAIYNFKYPVFSLYILDNVIYWYLKAITVSYSWNKQALYDFLASTSIIGSDFVSNTPKVDQNLASLSLKCLSYLFKDLFGENLQSGEGD